MLRRMLNRVIRWALRGGDPNLVCTEPVLTPKNALNNSRPNLNMSFYVGVGGKIVEFHKYDERTDQRISRIYVISDDRDMNEELTRVISMELMRA